MSRRHWEHFGLLIAITLWAAGPASAAVIEKDVAALTAQSQQIVIGDVREVTSFWDDQHARIKSHIVVQVQQYLVGTGSGTEVLEMSGGTVGDLTLLVSVLPVFQVGDHVLLFLGSSEIRLVESFQGAYLTDGVQVVRMGPGCIRAIDETRQPLAELLRDVQRALPAGQTLPALLPFSGAFELPPAGVRYAFCGPNWLYKPNPMGEDHKINPNCADASAGDAASQIAQIENGFNGWNNAGADFVFTYGGQTTIANVQYDGQNICYFDLTPPDGGGYVAATYYWASGNNLTECDLVFNDQSYTWWNGSGSCGGNKFDIWNIAAHETGHWLCLADLYGGGDVNKTMYGYVNYCEINKRTLETDDINGIIAIYGVAPPPDNTPPSPDPMTWATVPAPATVASISMVATTATDATSPPVQYFFHFVTGGPGGSDSAWQAGTSYTDNGLTPNTSYSYQVKARDSASTPNETAYSTEAAALTYIETPTGVAYGTVTTNSIDLQATGTLTNLTLGLSGVYFDSVTVGGDGGLNEWIQVTTDTATGLTPNKQYTFRVKARNQNGVETFYGPSSSKTTLANVPGAPVLSNATQTTMNLDVDPNGNPATTTFAIQCVVPTDPAWNGMYVDATGNPSAAAVWQADATWGNILIQGLVSGTQYCFQVKAQNGEAAETAFSPQSCAQTASGLVPGDMNCDGSVSFGDINPFVMALTSPAQYVSSYPNCNILNGDINGDGSVNFGDINPFVNCLTTGTCP
jgi:hypothetical protein